MTYSQANSRVWSYNATFRRLSLPPQSGLMCLTRLIAQEDFIASSCRESLKSNMHHNFFPELVLIGIHSCFSHCPTRVICNLLVCILPQLLKQGVNISTTLELQRSRKKKTRCSNETARWNMHESRNVNTYSSQQTAQSPDLNFYGTYSYDTAK
jgi:hypothetical protein